MLKIILLFSTIANAQNVQNSFEYSRSIYKKIEQVGKLNPEEFDVKINDIRKDIDKYVEHKKGVCQGDFSTVILGTSINNSANEFKLNKTEQELCYRELKAMQLTYINNLFDARKVYLNYLHKQRIIQLGLVREEALKQLQATFDKKLPPKK